jgi:hypothetical protein
MTQPTFIRNGKEIKTKWLTEKITGWDESIETLTPIFEGMRPYFGKKVIGWGGGGGGCFDAILDNVTFEKTILRSGKGFTLKAWMHDAALNFSGTNGEWDPYLGSWQISVRINKEEGKQCQK